MGIRVFMLTPTEFDRRSLRRYVSGQNDQCPVHGYHNATVEIGRVTRDDQAIEDLGPDRAKALDNRWPTRCACGYEFADADPWQDFRDPLYRRADNGELVALRDAPPGACWDAAWFHHRPEWCGPDGRSLVVVCPDGRQWMIDSRASNCTMPDDKVHKCWVRHGSPEAGDLHVDKDGVTCAAGAGSIDTGGYHGFLHHGAFT